MLKLSVLALVFSLSNLLADDYSHGGAGHSGAIRWGYRSQRDAKLAVPNQWGKISEKCEHGQTQSPIDLRMDNREEKTNANLVAPVTEYQPTEMDVFHNRHTVQATDLSDRNYVVYQDTRYFLRNVHYHTKSEHLIDGEQFDFEIHMVHESREKKLLVLGVVADVVSGSTPFGADLLGMVSKVEGRRDEYKPVKVVVDPARFLPQHRTFATYSGSLTTPPCSEEVRWIVFLEKRYLGSDEHRAFLEKQFGVGFLNFRPHFTAGKHEVQFSKRISN